MFKPSFGKSVVEEARSSPIKKKEAIKVAELFFPV